MEKSIIFASPNNVYMAHSFVVALDHFGYDYVEIDRGFFVTPEAYEEAIAPGFVNLMDLPVDSTEPYDLVAVKTRTTPELKKRNPELYQKLINL